LRENPDRKAFSTPPTACRSGLPLRASPPATILFLGAVVLGCFTAAPVPAAAAGEKPPVVVEPQRPVPITQADFVIGSGTPASVTLEALQMALSRGGAIVFNTGGKPVMLPVTKTLNLPVNTRPTVIDGGGLVTLDGLGRNQILVKGWKTLLAMQRLKFVAARAPKEGAAIKVENWDGALSVIDCQFDNCKTTEPGPDIGGGAIRALGQRHCLVSGCKFRDCAGSNGGAICSLGSQLTLVNCSFTNCTAFGFGGGQDARPKGKGMGGIGGAVYVDGVSQNGAEPRLYVGQCVFRNNSAGDHGGAIFAFTYKQAQNVSIFHASIFEGNKVTAERDLYLGFAGAVYTQDSEVYFLNSSFRGNACPKLGAAIFIATDRKVRVANCEIAGNLGQSNVKEGIWGPGTVEFGALSLVPLAHSPAEPFLGSLPRTQPEILGELKISYCKRQAVLVEGEGPLGPVLRELDGLARKDDPRGQEAQQVAAAVRKWAAAEVGRLATLAQTRPAAALAEMTRLDRRIKGLAEEKPLAAAMKPLQADRDVRNLAKILQSLAALKQRGSPSARPGAAAELKRLKESLSAIIADSEASEAVKKEAEEAAAGLK
jgi:predicted outer membrane repeat protein